MATLYIRTCQECGKRQVTKPPAEYVGDSWKDKKCIRCKSMALDYGSEQNVDPITLEIIEQDEQF